MGVQLRAQTAREGKALFHKGNLSIDFCYSLKSFIRNFFHEFKTSKANLQFGLKN